jgi:uncharacterized protein (DUF488 family)
MGLFQQPAGEAMSCEEPRTIHTIGHSTRSIEVFMELLKAHRIELLVDVRRWPTSTRFPHFGRERLAASLAASGVHYLWREDLGGYRKPSPDSPNSGWRVGVFRAYADFMLTPAFDRTMDELQPLAEARRIAVMCAEAVPWRCHRQLLADALLVRGWSARHILEDHCEEHALTSFARVRGTQILYPAVSNQRSAVSRKGNTGQQ